MGAREYEVVEVMRVVNIFHVTARTRKEAIEKVQNGERDWAERSDAWPIRQLRESDARLIRKAKEAS